MTDQLKTRSLPVDVVRGHLGLRVLIVGDAMLDTYVEGTAARLCKEGPVPVLERSTSENVPGGAANAAANLRALGADVSFVGLVGEDQTAAELSVALRERGVDCKNLVADHSCTTMRKTRVLANGQYAVRYDQGETRGCSKAALNLALDKVRHIAPSCDVVVISDYGYGAVSKEVIEYLKDLRRKRRITLVVDAKHPLRYATAGATMITPDFNEACKSIGLDGAGIPRSSPEEAERVGRQLLEIIDAEHLAITIAADGVMLVNRSGRAIHVPAFPVDHASDVGAGDSFTAATALALAAGADARLAVEIGIAAAGIAVTRHRTAVVTHQELLRRVSLVDPGPGQTPRTLAAVTDACRFAGKTVVFTNGVFDILHSGHVDLLRRTKNLGDVLIVGINSDASTRRLKGINRPINNERDRLALVSALEPVDHAIIFDEDHPGELIRALRPDIHVKGGDYTIDALLEADAVREVGARTEILSLIDGRSTTRIISKINPLHENQTAGAVS